MDLEDILAFNQITKDMDETEAKSLAHNLNFNYDDYKQRILGKEKEAEFIVILKSLGVLKNIEGYDEIFSHLTNANTPDFRIEFIDGYNILLEVKHTDKDEYKISLGNLQKRIDYAKNQNLPLRFAVSLKDCWGLFQSETLQNNNGKLTLDDFRGINSKSCFDEELGTCSYIFDKKIKIKSIYSINHPKSMGFSYEPYGKLISYELYYDDKRIFRVKGMKSHDLINIIYLIALQDSIGKIHKEIVKNGNFTVINEYKNENDCLLIPEYKFLLSPINHLTREINSKSIRYNSISAIKDQAFDFLPVEAFRAFMWTLVENGLNIMVLRNNKTYKFKDFAEEFWKSNKF